MIIYIYLYRYTDSKRRIVQSIVNKKYFLETKNLLSTQLVKSYEGAFEFEVSKNLRVVRFICQGHTSTMLKEILFNTK